MRTSNPALNEKSFYVVDYGVDFASDETKSRTMTVEGTVIKTITLLSLATISGAVTWSAFTSQSPLLIPFMVGGVMMGAVFAALTFFKQTWAPVTAPLYAVAEGLCLGGISAMFNAQFNGIALQAIGLTAGTLVTLLLAYQSGLVRAGDTPD